MPDNPTEYTDDDKARDLAALRSLTRKVTRARQAVSAAAAERWAVIHRLRTQGRATYPELAEALGMTYGGVQRLLTKAAEAEKKVTRADDDHTPHTDHLERESPTDDPNEEDRP